MKRRGTFLIAGLAIVALVAGALPRRAAAQSPRDELVVSAEWLMAHVADPDLVLLQAGGQGYDEGHIPGARLLDIGRLAISRGEMGAPDHLALELPENLDDVRAVLEEAGVSDGSRIVVTFQGSGVALATRAIWTLQVIGLGDRTSLLNGGNDAWRAAGGAFDDAVPTVQPGSITTTPRLDRRVDRSFVRDRSRADGVALLDARTAASYDGVEEEMPGRAGHIPGAANIHFRELYDDRVRLKPAAELREIFRRAGVEAGDTVVAYCHIGLWATNLVLAARTLGFDAVLYDGSMHDWAADPDLPLETGGSR